MAIYRYVVTVETSDNPLTTAQVIADEIDSNLESVVLHLGIEDFEVTWLSTTQVFPAYTTHEFRT